MLWGKTTAFLCEMKNKMVHKEEPQTWTEAQNRHRRVDQGLQYLIVSSRGHLAGGEELSRR